MDGKQHWHDYCYSCVKCELSLVGVGYFTVGNLEAMYCAICYDELESNICQKCKTKINRCSLNEKVGLEKNCNY